MVDFQLCCDSRFHVSVHAGCSVAHCPSFFRSGSGSHGYAASGFGIGGRSVYLLLSDFYGMVPTPKGSLSLLVRFGAGADRDEFLQASSLRVP